MEVGTSGLSLADRLKKAGIPATAPPEGLPAFASAFARVWETLQLGPETAVDTLVTHAMRSPFEMILLENILFELRQGIGKMEVNPAKQLRHTLRKLQHLPGRYASP